MDNETEAKEFRCGHCGHEAPFEQSMIVTHGARAYIYCPKCGYEESDRYYSTRKVRESW
jgi:predicted RNA-binding Zn-ribbon protein involved in translation (DUF1610 family)